MNPLRFEDNGFNFDVKSLICFKKVAEMEHMTRAAHALYISQAQLSRIIQDLEAEFDVKFFDRVGKGIKLNNCGRYFYNYVTQMYDLTTKTQRKVREIYLHEQTQLTVASNSSSFLIEAMRAFHGKLPEVKYRQITVTRRKCLSLLKEGVVDVSLCIPMLEDAEITGLFLRQEPAIVIYPEGHWLQGREKVSLRELTGEQLIGQTPGYAVREATDRAFKRYGYSPEYSVEGSEIFFVSRMVANNLGIAFVPYSLFSQDDFFGTHYAVLEEPVFGSVGISWRKDKQLSETAKLFVDILTEFFAGLPNP
ncbi:MAG: LysR family transcriptional regulator [Oscillospiraceae bacterium]|nr:LysR family transcriptional regulator [Oscillospiraceae bacterium]